MIWKTITFNIYLISHIKKKLNSISIVEIKLENKNLGISENTTNHVKELLSYYEE